ncbi:AlkA N-terminal domain-containing protein [Nocardioides sp. SYSU DS0663]|uniref:AlkA N-terminal domain-containing protein n=1 Tax=Nocardioides sp. SYSU DS0663 TaxID=3416445 RepID=UPI003F4B626F
MAIDVRRDARDPESCYRAVLARDRRFDGIFWTGVRTTGIYCRPSCPARTPAYANVTFHPSAAAAQGAGFRACKRCLPDATPGSPEWDVAATVAGRAMRLIADGVVDREGVDGLARRVGYTPRHLSRILLAELGAGPLALARARRAQTARVLIETTGLSFTDVAFAAGFSSVRQFNDTVREVYGASPTQLRGGRADGRMDARSVVGSEAGVLRLRLAVRTPFAGRALLDFLAHHLVPGVEVAGDGWYARTLDLPHGPGTVRLDLADELEGARTAFVPATFTLHDLRDTTAAVERVRRLLDADCDPLAVAEHLGADALLGALVRRWPGLRVPGQVDGDETALRTVVGQQVSVAGARTVTGRLVAAHGRPVVTHVPGLTHLFPRPAALAGADPATLPMPRARGRALVGLASALAAGKVPLDRRADRAEVRRRLLELPGVGPWTADYVAMRALGDPDIFLPTDVGVRRALTTLSPGAPVPDPAAVADRWRPWRSYALLHLWSTLIPPVPDEPDATGPPVARRTDPLDHLLEA